MTSPRTRPSFIRSFLGRKSSPHLSSSYVDTAGAEQVANSRRNTFPPDAAIETGLPLDIWYIIAHDHLVNSPDTIAALCLTCRHLNHVLGFLKYRQVSIRLTVCTPYKEGSAKSPAEIFAEKLQKHQGIIDHLELLRIRQGEDGELHALHASPNKEQMALCDILSQQYPILKGFVLSVKCATTFPSIVLKAVRSCFCRPSLSTISFLDFIPVELINELGRHNHTLNLVGRLPSPMTVQNSTDIRGQYAPRTLRIAHEHTARSLFFINQQPMLSLERLSSLALKASAGYLPIDITNSSGFCSSTLMDFMILFTGWDVARDPVTLFLGQYAALKTLSLDFTTFTAGQRTIRQGLQWVMDALSTFIDIEPPPRLESLSYNLTIGSLHLESNWNVHIKSISWCSFQTLFSPDWISLRWPALRYIFVNIKGIHGTDHSNCLLIKQVLHSKMIELVQTGHLTLSVLNSSMDAEFDDWLSIQ
ncbi:hypothetical protein CVT26_007244 [Gymnopilus dilepis]|uniref:Uncharacterized protein n=1 Tax=Gymnopilus dilepis TaxID=231916 RepID=A0A409VMG0_9AGAR|nr:hypothetical protein CVT26_007244 [Gymnopilus dilepis]